MKRWLFNKQFGGILWHFIFAGLFIGLSLIFLECTEGVTWYLVSTALRLMFGTAILLISIRLFEASPRDIMSLRNTKGALLSGFGFLLFFVYYCFTVASGFGGIAGLSVEIFLSKVLLQQIMTGFYEELNYRYLLLEGLKNTKNSLSLKLLFTLGSAVLFGLLHCVTGWSTYTFLQTGAIGFTFAVIFVCSGNIMIPMLLHFIYDLFAKLAPYVTWNHTPLFDSLNSAFEIMLAVMFAISLVILILNDRRVVHNGLE